MLLLQKPFKFRLLTDFNADLPLFFETGSSRESLENRLVVPERARVCTGISCSISFSTTTDERIVTGWGNSAIDEGKRPNGSGERGITGASPSDGSLLGTRILCSSSSSLRRFSDSVGPLAGNRLGANDLGAEVVTPLTASRGGGGALGFSAGCPILSLFLIAEKGTAGHDLLDRSSLYIFVPSVNHE